MPSLPGFPGVLPVIPIVRRAFLGHSVFSYFGFSYNLSEYFASN